MSLPRAINVLSKPAYEPRDKPRFDKGRFGTMVARDHINGFGGGGKLGVSPVAGDADPDGEPGVDSQIKTQIEAIAGSGACGAALSATWQGGNKAEPSAKVARPAKSYEDLLRAARPTDADGNPRPHWDPKYNYDWTDSDKLKAEKYSYRCEAAQPSYGDIRRDGKARCNQDVTHAQAAKRERDTFLAYAIDEVASKRRQQINRQRETRLWRQERSRKQPKRILYLLKQPRTLIEARFLMEALSWLLSDYPRSGVLRWEYIGKAVNVVTDEAIKRSKKNDALTPKLRRRVLPTAYEELELARSAKAGDPIARQRLLDVHWPLVCSIATKHVTGAHQLGELIGEGYLGLIEAWDKFDPEKGYRLSTFAMRPIGWRILDYKRREQKKDIPLDGEVLEWAGGLADLGNFNDSSAGTSRTSRIIIDTTNRMTGHISPYKDGLAPETHDFIAALNSEAELHNSGVKFVGLANKIEVNGNIKDAAEIPNLGGWFLRRALRKGFSEGEEAVLKGGNSKYKKHLRKIAKRKPK